MTTSWNHEEHQKLTSSKSFVLLNDELSWDRMVLFFHLFSESSPLPESLGRNLWITNSAFGSPDFQTFWLCWKRGITSSRTLVADNLFQDLLSPISWDNSLWILSFLFMSISVYDLHRLIILTYLCIIHSIGFIFGYHCNWFSELWSSCLPV